MTQQQKRYQAHVYHGGSLAGLGRWASGKRWRDRRRAEREGARLADQAYRVVGGSPIVDIAEINLSGKARCTT